MKITVRVPATTANLGPGFDCLGLALKLWNTITVRESPSEGVDWRDCERRPLSGDELSALGTNLTLTAMSELFRRGKVGPPAVQVRATNCIPIGRGLGSSAAAIVGGLVAVNAWIGDHFSRQELLELAVELEGHPDNVSAALLGGLTIAIREGNKTYATSVRPPRAWRAILFIPDQGLSTKFARTVLPARVEREDAVYNIGRAALLTRAFTLGDAAALDLATGDRLHEPYRAHLVPGMDEFCGAASRAGAHGVALSGAGPSMIAFAASPADALRVERALARTARRLHIPGSTRIVGLSSHGATARRDL